MFLTHADDVADHAQWAAKMGVQRIIHRLEADPRLAMTKRAGQGLGECEVQLEGHGPWDPFGGDLGSSTRVLSQPGHTPGSLVLHFQPDDESSSDGGNAAAAVAFTGDHLAVSGRTGLLQCFTAYNRQPLEVQVASLREWAMDPSAEAVKLVLPGHGRWHATDTFVADLLTVASNMQHPDGQ